MKKIMISLYLISGLFLLAGCQTPGTLSSQPAAVAAKPGNPLVEGGNQSGTWKGRDVTVDYKYVRSGSQIELSGVASFSDSITLLYARLQDFQLRAVFTDEQGRIVETRPLVTSHGGFDPVPFKTTLAIPGRTAALSFAYQGTAIESGGDEGGGGGNRFWEGPIQ